MATKQLRETRRIELVETHNICLSIQRMNMNDWDGIEWRRALYHALAMSGVPNSVRLKNLREALELP